MAERARFPQPAGGAFGGIPTGVRRLQTLHARRSTSGPGRGWQGQILVIGIEKENAIGAQKENNRAAGEEVYLPFLGGSFLAFIDSLKR
jgi:hypothetical protein